MSDLVPRIPHGWRSTGQLRDSQYPEFLNRNMLEVKNDFENILIHAGWEPEEDVNGHYSIFVIRDCELIEGPHFVDHMTAAGELVSDIAFKYATSVSKSISMEMPRAQTIIKTRFASRSSSITREVEYA